MVLLFRFIGSIAHYKFVHWERARGSKATEGESGAPDARGFRALGSESKAPEHVSLEPRIHTETAWPRSECLKTGQIPTGG